MRRIKSKILGFVLVLATTVAWAATLTVQWAPPTERADGTPLDISEIKNYNIVCGDKVTEVPANNTPSFVTSQEDILPGYGSYDCYMTTVDTSNVESAPSDTFAVTWLAPPNPPTQIIILIGN